MKPFTIAKGNHPASFRDPAGCIFYENGKLFRRVEDNYFDNLEKLESSDLYKTLVTKKLLIPHKLVASKKTHKILLPETIDSIS